MIAGPAAMHRRRGDALHERNVRIAGIRGHEARASDESANATMPSL